MMRSLLLLVCFVFGCTDTEVIGSDCPESGCIGESRDADTQSCEASECDASATCTAMLVDAAACCEGCEDVGDDQCDGECEDQS